MVLTPIVFLWIGRQHLTNVIVQLKYTPKTFIFISLVMSVIFASFLVESQASNVVDPLIEKKVQQLVLNPDTLYHASVSENLRNYGVASTGMHGLNPVYYHIFSHFLFSRISIIMEVPAYIVYGFGSVLFFGPLLLLFLLEVSQEFAKGWNGLLKVIFVFLSLAAILTKPFVTIFGSHFYSESYLVSLIFFAAFMSAVGSLSNRKISAQMFLLIPLCLLFITLSKISVGVIAFAILGVFLIFQKNYLSSRVITFFGISLIFFVIGYIGSKPQSDIKGLEVRFVWKFFQSHFASELSLPQFIFSHFIYFWLVVPISFLLLLAKKMTKNELILSLAFLLVTFIGFVGLNITIDSSGYYFSNLHAFFSLFLASAFSKRLPKKIDFTRKYPIYVSYLFFVFLIFIVLVGNFLTSRARSSLKIISEITKEVRDNSFDDGYIQILKEVRKIPRKDLLVYIPKSEVNFWNNQSDNISPWKHQQCIKMPFFVPMVSGKPSLFGLPMMEGSKTQCYNFVRGYEGYPQQVYKKSQQMEHLKNELCDETIRLGFNGYVEIRYPNYIIKECK
ncbi:hypothetical protein [Leptospira terpstrae]|uniref:hypothetical protein n=1 Tax=Leptospira terpstrae TaxID=293075 RepID=UPI0018DB412D|nr:hypothetical protein [Leptospira terpstrae]